MVTESELSNQASDMVIVVEVRGNQELCQILDVLRLWGATCIHEVVEVFNGVENGWFPTAHVHKCGVGDSSEVCSARCSVQIEPFNSVWNVIGCISSVCWSRCWCSDSGCWKCIERSVDWPVMR